jgi:hypothetical protein
MAQTFVDDFVLKVCQYKESRFLYQAYHPLYQNKLRNYKVKCYNRTLLDAFRYTAKKIEELKTEVWQFRIDVIEFNIQEDESACSCITIGKESLHGVLLLNGWWVEESDLWDGLNTEIIKECLALIKHPEYLDFIQKIENDKNI